jgi:hypothetical protein
MVTMIRLSSVWKDDEYLFMTIYVYTSYKLIDLNFDDDDLFLSVVIFQIS